MPSSSAPLLAGLAALAASTNEHHTAPYHPSLDTTTAPAPYALEHLNHTLAPFGARVHLHHSLTPHKLPQDVARQLWQELTKHQVLVFPKLGERLDMNQHVAFARQFGTVDPWVSRPPPYALQNVHLSTNSWSKDLSADGRTVGDTSEESTTAAATTAVPTATDCVAASLQHHGCKALQSTVIEARDEQVARGEPTEVFKLVVAPTDELAFGEGFHTDLTYLEKPPVAALLIGRDLPPSGGDTLFQSSYHLLEALPVELHDKIRGGVASLHSDRAGRQAVHPLVQSVHGRDALYVNRHQSRHIVEEHEEALGGQHAAQELLNKLFTHVLDTGLQRHLSIKWEKDMLVMWDERSTQHAAIHDYAGHRREMHRVLISDARPGFETAPPTHGTE